MKHLYLGGCKELVGVVKEFVYEWPELVKIVEKLKRGEKLEESDKLWGAVTALVKLYAARKNVYVLHWGRGKLEIFITYNVEEKYKQLFRTLLDKVQVFHENFYEANLDDKTFDERWMEAVELVSKVREVVLSGLTN
jgi:hypothetical protein